MGKPPTNSNNTKLPEDTEPQRPLVKYSITKTGLIVQIHPFTYANIHTHPHMQTFYVKSLFQLGSRDPQIYTVDYIQETLKSNVLHN